MSKQNIVGKWMLENAPLGIELGYPTCCILEFCNQPPELMTGKPTKDDKRRVKAGHINNKWSGFIPCSVHAKQIVMGKITLHSLIKNRKTSIPFPEW